MATLELSSGTLQQETFDKVGDGFHYSEIELLKDNKYTANYPYKLNSGTTITGPEDTSAVITLSPGLSRTLFPSMTPIFGQAGSTISDILVENITFKGNRLAQAAAGIPHGQGFDNFVGLKNGKNITIRNIIAGESQGDIARLTDCENILYCGNLIKEAGHEGLYADRCSGVEAWNNTTYCRTNSALRSKGSKGVSFHDNLVFGTTEAYSPGIQVENSEEDETTSEISIYNNTIQNTLGPGVWAAGLRATAINAAKNLLVRNNLIINCGLMPAGNGIPGVGGMVVDGWDNVTIKDNTINGCLGYGILFGRYQTTSSSSGYSATVKNNIITNTKKNLVGTQGLAIANQGRYILDISDNCFYGNVSNGLTGSAPVLKDPLFVNGYHLSAMGGHYTESGYVLDSVNSPCIYSGGEAGRYNGTNEASRYCIIEEDESSGGAVGEPEPPEEPVKIIVTCSSQDVLDISKSLTEEYSIYKKV